MDNEIDVYEIQIRDYYRMTLYLVGSALKIKVSLKIVPLDTEEIVDPLYNRDKIYDRPIMNVDIDREENKNINNRVRNVI